MIYFIRAGENGPIKIGKATDPMDRLNVLQTGCPEKLQLLATITTANDDDAERYLHSRLRACAIRGEWFVSNEFVMSSVRAALAGELMAPDCGACGETPKGVRIRRAVTEKKSRWSRDSYNAYQRVYVAVWRAVKAGRACWWPHA